MICAVIINAGQANAAMRDAGYQDVRIFKRLSKLKSEEILIESIGVIGQRIKKEALLNSLAKMINSIYSSSVCMCVGVGGGGGEILLLLVCYPSPSIHTSRDILSCTPSP